MNSYEELIKIGSDTARAGFRNEQAIADKFNNWESDSDSQKWLIIMQYDIEEIDYVKATTLHGYKSDVQVQVTVKLKEAISVENLQVKLVSNFRGFNQIDKRWLASYNELWNFPGKIFTCLKHFTGELPPKIGNPRDDRRMFLDEFPKKERDEVLDFFSKNKALIVNDILKGRGKFAAEWILVAQKIDMDARWVLKPINVAINYYSNGSVKISPRGSIYIHKITVQRKGGDGGRPTANMLQFKINPAELFEITGT